MLNRRNVWKLCALLLALSCGRDVAFGQEPTAEQPAAPKPSVAIRAGKVLTSVGDPIIDGVILVADKKIVAVGKFGEIVI
nr:hypothetical protein [Pirellula sp.]